MPFYRCLIPKGSLSYVQRERIAVAFTDVHCGISTAPRRFVQVAFLETTATREVADTHGSGMLSVRHAVLYRRRKPRGPASGDEASDLGRLRRERSSPNPVPSQRSGTTSQPARMV